MLSYYFILNQIFIDQNQGYQSGPNIFNAVQDNQGRWVCSVNSVTEFPEIFEGNAFEVVGLTENDFPQLGE